MNKIQVGIVGYGNVAKGVEKAIAQNPDMALAAVFTRRDPQSLAVNTAGVPVLSVDDAPKMTDQIDVLILCGGSATDLPEQGPHFARYFNIVDSFDTHAKIPAYFSDVNAAAQTKTAVISAGWDPGLFSILRMMGGAVLPVGEDYTFWGKGVSQGHSDAIRRLAGVACAIQYTVPIPAAVEAARSGENPVLTPRQKHLRECYVVAEAGADTARIEADIKAMPHYFADYDTTVHFISENEFTQKHSQMPHGGFVIRSGRTGDSKQVMEFSLTLDSNPEFTASVLVAYARAAVRLSAEGSFGAKTVFDIPPAYLSSLDGETLRKTLL